MSARWKTWVTRAYLCLLGEEDAQQGEGEVEHEVGDVALEEDLVEDEGQVDGLEGVAVRVLLLEVLVGPDPRRAEVRHYPNDQGRQRHYHEQYRQSQNHTLPGERVEDLPEVDEIEVIE